MGSRALIERVASETSAAGTRCDGGNGEYARIEVWTLISMPVRRAMRAAIDAMLVLTGATITILMLVSAPADAKRAPLARRPVVLHATFHRYASGVAGLLADGRYVFLSGQFAADGTQGGVLVDDQTGQRTLFTPPTGCSTPVIGGPWLIFAICPSGLQLDPLAGGPARPVAGIGAGEVPVAVGRDWIEYRSNCDTVHSCSTYSFQSIASGAVHRDPTSASTLADLDSPQLAHRTCRGLSVPTSDFLVPPTDWLVSDGKLALADTAGGVVVKQCAGPLHLVTHAAPAQITASPRAIVWQAQNKLAGVSLPSLKPFTLRLPARGSYTLALGPRTLYILDPQGQMWTTSAAVLTTRH